MKAALVAAALIALASSAHAQGLGFGSSGSNQPIEITARDGIEWLRDSQRYIARGDAVAKQGDTTVSGDMLTAYYRSQPDGGTEIFRYEAIGKVRIATPTQAAVGDRGVYDVDTGVLVLTGSNLRFTTPTETLTAKDSLEYWENRRSAVARGGAAVVSQDRRMTGDILTAYFLDTAAAPARPAPAAARNAAPALRSAPAARPAPQPASSPRPEIAGNGKLQRVEAFGNVHVSTATDIVKADRGVYNAETSIAVMSGNVRITRGEQMLGGEYVEVNLATGVSRLTTTGDGRVTGVLTPNRADAPRPAQSGPPPAARTPPPPPARQNEQQQQPRSR